VRARIGARSAIRRGTEPIGGRTGGQREHWNDRLGLRRARHRTRGRTGRSGLGGVAPLCASTYRPICAFEPPPLDGLYRIGRWDREFADSPLEEAVTSEPLSES